MSELQTLVEKLQDSEAMVAQMRDALAENPADEILRSNMLSIEKRRRDLTRRLDVELNMKQAELVRYRILRTWTDVYPAKAVASSIAYFQELFTAVFDALKTRPKLQYRPSLENEQLSTFEFAGASAGSVIVSLAVPNDRLLVGKTEMDQTFEIVERIISARESEDLKLLADKVGVAAISKAYAWAKETESYGLDVEIRWGKSLSSMHELQVAREDASIVKTLIENKSDTDVSTVEIVGRLVGFDGDRSYFHIVREGDSDIFGSLADDLPRSWTTEEMYVATLKREAQIKYSTGEEKEKWTLLRLQPVETLR